MCANLVFIEANEPFTYGKSNFPLLLVATVSSPVAARNQRAEVCAYWLRSHDGTPFQFKEIHSTEGRANSYVNVSDGKYDRVIYYIDFFLLSYYLNFLSAQFWKVYSLCPLMSCKTATSRVPFCLFCHQGNCRSYTFHRIQLGRGSMYQGMLPLLYRWEGISIVLLVKEYVFRDCAQQKKLSRSGVEYIMLSFANLEKKIL